MTILSWLAARLAGVITTLALTFATVSAQPAARFDMTVRSDFFAGFAGDEARLSRGMAACERTLEEDPQHAEALVWHGSGLFFRAGLAFQKSDTATGMDLWTRGMKEMDTAVALAPDNVGVRIPRGAMLLQSSRFAPPDMMKPLVEKGLQDYERTLELQSGFFDTLGDHPKGELLFGLADGYGRLGNAAKARTYFERLIAAAPTSGHAPQAKTYVDSGVMPAVTGLGCIGCHK
jgi:tetratricopeptide (TPR) repeat protein